MSALDIVMRQLTRDEDRRHKPYPDTSVPPRLTIGVGRNLTDNGLRDDEIDMLLHNDVLAAQSVCWNLFVGFKDLDIARQAALLNLAFALGGPKLQWFVFLREAVKDRDWDRAAAEVLNSKWAKQVGARANRVAEQLRTGDEV